MGKNVARVLLLIMFAVSLHAQTREEITVEVVNVPVYIYEGTKPVDGLTRDDFELLVNGTPQSIDYFDVMDLGKPVTRPDAPASVAEQRRLFLLLFDVTFTSPGHVLRGQRAAKALVEHSPSADAFAVATFSPGNGMEIQLQFTSDREAILGTIATLNPAHDPAIVAAIDLPPDVAGGGGEITQNTSLSRDLSAEPLRRLAELHVEGLNDIGGALRKIEGFNKHVILISEGFRGASAPRIVSMIEKMQQNFHGANAFLHTLDTAGLRFTYNQSRRTFDVGAGDSLRQLSTATGGQWMHNSNDLAGALTKLTETYRRAYILGFRAKSAREGHNSIVVRVKKLPRGAHVSYRQGFVAVR